MDPVSWKDKLSNLLSRYKYVCIVILAGLVLMWIPGQDSQETQPEKSIVQPKSDAAEDLEKILSMIHGVGKVQVMLTISEGEQTRYVYDEDRDQDMDSTSHRRNTVIVSDSQRADQGLVQQIIPPVYLGAIIVCEGGNDPSVCLDVVTAVSNATGLSADRITVLKMK